MTKTVCSLFWDSSSSSSLVSSGESPSTCGEEKSALTKTHATSCLMNASLAGEWLILSQD